MKKFTNQELDNALQRVPSVIQKELATGYDTADVISSFQSKYNLHIDKLSLIAELNRNMLLGLTSPEEFMQEMLAAGIPNQDAQGILMEINQKIFLPLQEKTRRGSENVAPAPKPAPAPRPAISQSDATAKIQEALSEKSAFIPANPSLPQRPPEIGFTKINIQRPAPPSRPAAPAPQSINVLQNRPAQPREATPPAPMQAPVDMAHRLSDHEEPHITVAQAPRTSPSAPTMPARTAPPPPNLPGALPPPASPRATQGTATPPLRSQPPVPTTYTVDPYREPLDDK